MTPPVAAIPCEFPGCESASETRTLTEHRGGRVSASPWLCPWHLLTAILFRQNMEAGMEFEPALKEAAKGLSPKKEFIE